MKLAGLLFLLFLPFQAVAQESDFKPASFSDSPDSLQNLLVFPEEIDEDIDIAIPCKAYLNRWGEIDRLSCFRTSEQFPQLEQAIQATQQSAKFEPALAEGSRTAVIFQFTVRFIKVGNLESIEVFPHFGFNVESLGFNYTSPQVILPNRSSSLNGRYRISDSRDMICPVGVKFILMVSVGVDGVSTEVSFGNTEYFPSSCERDSRNYFGSLPFIPAFKDGKPVEANFVDFIGR